MKIGLLGAGRIGSFHAKSLASDPSVASLRITDVNQERADAVAADVNATTASDATELAAWADALVIATATDTHAELIRLGAEARLPVFCEKPIALDLDSTNRVLDSVDKAGIQLQIGFQRRFDRGFLEARRMVESGEIGTLYSARLATHDPAPPPAEYIKICGGLFRDMLIHDFDLIRWVTGDEVVEVYAAGGTLTGNEAFEQAGDVDSSVVVLRMRSGALVIISGLRHDPRGYDVRLELFGSNDAVVAGMDSRTPIGLIDDDRQPGDKPAYRDFMDRFESSYRDELSAFLSVARGEKDSPCTGVDAKEALRIATAATLSLHEKRPVALEEIN